MKTGEDAFKNKKVAILGFGIEGKDLAKYLLKKGARITVFDRKNEKELDLSEVDKRRLKLVCGENYLEKGLKSFDIVFRSPGVYRYIPEINSAEKSNVEISSLTKLFFELSPARIIGVTGTKGKGTTSTLIYKILKETGKDVYLAGNIGKPYLEFLSKLTPKSWVVLELSSFQLIDLTKSPNIAVVLNITTDHLDWHKDRNEYIKSKIRLVEFQNAKDYAVLNYDYKTSRNFSKHTKAKLYYFSRINKVNGVYVKNGKIILEEGSLQERLRKKGKKWEVGDTKNLLLRGQHNWENVCAAVCAAYLAGADLNSIRKVVFSFKGLEHRLELVGEINSVSFYNDSFSTNPQTTIAAIKSFKEDLTLILGGSDKGLNYDKLGKVIANAQNIKNVILIGEISPIIQKSIQKAKYKGNLILLNQSVMSKIVNKAIEVTPVNGVVLLSPAAASFDMFKDYKDRGNQFKEVVRSLQSAT